MGLFDRISKFNRRALTGSPTSITAETHLAWMSEQIRAYATPQPFAGPLTAGNNFTGETWEMRMAYRTMLKEPAVAAPLLAKTFAVASLDPQVQPDDKNNPEHKKAAAWVDWTISRAAGGWPGLLMNVMLPGQFDGFSVSEKVFEPLESDHEKYPHFWALKAARSKDSQFIRYRLDEYKNVVAIQAMAAGQGAVQLDPADFILFTHLKIFENPFGQSALRPVVRAANLIAAAVKLRSILLENFSGPFLALKYSNTALIEQAKVSLANARARGYIVIGKDDELNVLNLATSAPDQFQATIEDLRKEASLGLRGAYLQSLESTSPQGNSNTHRSQTELFDWYLMVTACACLTEQLAPDLVEPNFGKRGGRPIITLGGIDPESVMKELDKIKSVVNDLRLPASATQVYELTGVEPPKDENDKIAPAPTPTMGGGSTGGSDPFGGSGGGFGHPAPPPAPTSHGNLVLKEVSPGVKRWVNPLASSFAEGGTPAQAGTFPDYDLAGELLRQ